MTYAQEPLLPEIAIRPPCHPQVIVVIDDEPHIRRILNFKLTHDGYTVLMAHDGEAGLALIQEHRPDAVITDINMPRLDGKSLCLRIDGLKRDKPFLTIILSCRISPDEECWVDSLQDTIFMEKPFSPHKLLQTLTRYFQEQPR